MQGTVYSVQDSVYGQLSGMTTTQLNGLTDQDYTSDYAIVKALLGKAFEQALANGSNVSKYLVSNEVNKADFESLIENFRNAVGTDVFDKAISELFKAYIDANGITGTPDYVVGPGGGSAVVTDPSVAQLAQELAALKSKIATATGEEKDKLIAQAIAKANEVVAKILTLDLSSKVQNVNGKATLTLSAADVTKLIAAVADAKKALADAVGTADGLNIGDIVINLGAITQSGASVTLPQELWTLANDVKADGVAIKVGALSATLPVGTFTEAVTLGVTIESGDAASSVTSGVYGKSVASDVYGFDLQVGGKAVEQFNKPIKLRLPLKNLTGVDKELLTTGRVEADGKVSTQGGTLDGDFIVEPRYSFSKYFVFENKVSFNDIAKVQSWAGRQIEVVAAKGAIEGKSAGIFAPQDKITRAEFAKILITALNLDNTLATSSKFSDVPASHWAAPYIAVAAEQGIINGKTASTFAPNATITRAEMATMIARALKATQGLKDIDNAEAALSVFKDANKIGSAFRSSVAWAAASDIIIGANGKFLPNNNATRAEAAVIIYRAINFKPQA
ncbi:S-layer homology domain-containing protein [Cohnella sp. OV330]|uniref:S-layer homology domain-containing protein n=1 Tax=Cohnella sp. OV330 TaxID=1855288 RepID=UPI0011605917|nr:S-layer homology domain-containing protein [Cohnella sp. OV330]